ncbi:MAG: D-alanine aminotransferase [Verrucomicrobia subdivision 3 bacterium]|nr:D-alanine aminotransferase [Limisphaerales bacterium]MCS1414674.1 D-alanine aminotransferase [Limisphaerales bacterium]
MIVYVNGDYVPQESATLSVFDRGLMYGDGCFETLRVYSGRPAFWPEHIARLTHAVAALSIPIEIASDSLAKIAQTLIHQNSISEALLRIHVTRGQGPRGYSIANVQSPSLIISLHPTPNAVSDPAPTWRLVTSTQRIDNHSMLHRHKSSNKLLQILGKAEADRSGADDVLFLTHDGKVAETSSANLFWFDGHALGTPPLSAGILPGITRQIVKEICDEKELPCNEANLTESELLCQQTVFLTQSAWEIIKVGSLNNIEIPTSPIIEELRQDYRLRAMKSPFM